MTIGAHTAAEQYIGVRWLVDEVTIVDAHHVRLPQWVKWKHSDLFLNND